MSKYDFNNAADTYDNWYNTDFGKKIDFFEKRVFKKYLDKFSSKTILEIGSGTGHWSRVLSENGFFVLGVDIADKLIEIANSKNIPFTTFINSDVLSLPYNSETIENVVAVTSLEFVADKNKAFDEIYRVLKKDACLLIGAINAYGSLAYERENNSVFENCSPFTNASLYERLKVIGEPEIEGCALFPDGKNNLIKAEEIELNANQEQLNNKGNFLVGFVRKK